MWLVAAILDSTALASSSLLQAAGKGRRGRVNWSLSFSGEVSKVPHGTFTFILFDRN